MKEQQKRNIILESWKMHAEVEAAYLQQPAAQGDKGWPEKQQLLLADMALHLLQTALAPNALDKDKLKNNLNAIMTISDEYLPHAELKKAADKLYQE